MAACRLWRMACSWGKKRNESAHYAQKCAISYVMLLNFLAYMHFCGARACIFLKRPYLCIVFFIVLDLRLTRLGYSGIPFFCPYAKMPRCVRLERHMCHSVKLFAPKGFLLCRCWWGAWLVSFFSFLLFFLLIFPTRDASPPLEVAFPFLLFFLLFFLLIFPTRDASPPLEVAFDACVWC